MPAIVSQNIRVFSAQQFISAFQSKKYSKWASGVSYSIGDVVYNSFYKYIAITAGTSGALPPTHTSGAASDGGVDWLFVELFTNTAYFNNNLYVAIGKNQSWDNPGAGDETPTTPVDDSASQYTILNDVISMKRLESTSVKFAVARHDWTSGTVYDRFDPAVADFNYSNPLYVLTDENNIYKCVNNRGGIASTSKPTGTSTDLFTTADGYVWKYMATISASDAIQFLTDSHIPVEKKLSDDGSFQWAVQQAAKRLSLSSVVVSAGGSGYTTATVTIGAPDDVSGTQATAVAVIDGGAIVGIQLTNIGSGYTTVPTVTITGDGTGAIATAVQAPKEGHGANILTELNARYVIVNARFDDTESGYFPVSGENDFRQISLVLDPKKYDGTNATSLRYIGPGHDLYVGDGSSGLEELQAGSGIPIYIENIAPVVRASGQTEDLKIILRF